MTIPYLTTWTETDLAFLRASIEDAERCPTYGAGKVPASPTHPCIDWLQERFDRLPERLPQMGVNSCMTEILLLYANECIGGGLSHHASKPCVLFPLTWLLALARIWVRTEKCPGEPPSWPCSEGKMAQKNNLGYTCECHICHGSGTISPDRERVERMKGWRVIEARGEWYVVASAPNTLDGPLFTHEAAEQELRRRVLAEFADCGRTVECPKCHGTEGWSDGDDWEECPKCIEGKLVIRPKDFQS